MSDDEQPQPSRGSFEFVESSIIQTIIPECTDSSLEYRLQASVADNHDIDVVLQNIALRQTLFFGE